MIRAILAFIFAVLFLIISLPVYFISWLIGRKKPKALAEFSQRFISFGLKGVSLICCVKLEVKGLDQIDPDGTYLYIANHASIFDVILGYPVLPTQTGFLAKKELRKVPVLGMWLERCGGLFLDRKNPKQGLQVILTAIDQVKAGQSVFIFPEGTRTKDGNLNEFKAGSFKVATRTDCPIVPIAMTHTADIVRKHIPFVKSTKVTIQFGLPIRPSQLDPEDKKHIGVYMQSRVQKMLDDSNAVGQEFVC